MNSDFKNLLKILNDYKVHYLDIWIEASPKNARDLQTLEKFALLSST